VQFLDNAHVIVCCFVLQPNFEYIQKMKRWVTLFVLFLIVSMHGLFEAAKPVAAAMSNAPAFISADVGTSTVSMKNVSGDSGHCCVSNIIDLHDLHFNCPLDGKILSAQSEFVRSGSNQLKMPIEHLLLAGMFEDIALRPPIL